MKTRTKQDYASEGRPVTHRDHAISQPAAPPVETVTMQVRNQLRSAMAAMTEKIIQEKERFEERQRLQMSLRMRGRKKRDKKLDSR